MLYKEAKQLSNKIKSQIINTKLMLLFDLEQEDVSIQAFESKKYDLMQILKDINELENHKIKFISNAWKRNPNKWLTTTDINNVMYQYEEAYPHFKYMGAHPIDFDKKIEGGVCVSDDLCNIDIKKLGKKKKSLGMVFNTDPHYKSGQPWVSIYVDLMGKNQKNKPCIYYFDSVAKDPPEEIIILINRIKEQCNLINKKINVAYNDIEHQSGNTECGIYCLHFLISMLKGKNFKNYIHNVRTDNEIEKFRNIFYSTI